MFDQKTGRHPRDVFRQDILGDDVGAQKGLTKNTVVRYVFNARGASENYGLISLNLV